jgi:hypothetical protein
MDSAIAMGRTSLDTPTRAGAYKTVQQQLIQDAPVVIFAPFPFDYIVGKNVLNLKYINGQQVDWTQIQVKQ